MARSARPRGGRRHRQRAQGSGLVAATGSASRAAALVAATGSASSALAWAPKDILVALPILVLLEGGLLIYSGSIVLGGILIGAVLVGRMVISWRARGSDRTESNFPVLSAGIR